jgi:hypothetical protein
LLLSLMLSMLVQAEVASAVALADLANDPNVGCRCCRRCWRQMLFLQLDDTVANALEFS